jgi:hypothetical protein
MKRWMVIVLVIIGLALGAGIQGFADSGADKVKAANLRAAQDYYKSGLMLAGEGRETEAVKAFHQALGIRPDWAEACWAASCSGPANTPRRKSNCARPSP